jgi:hypothetical protein
MVMRSSLVVKSVGVLSVSIDLSDNEIAERWIAERKDSTHRQLQGGFRSLNKLCNEDPARALQIIELIANKDSSDPVIEVLAAGPLENLLVKHGSAVIDRIEQLANENPVFRMLMGGVWQRETDSDVWERVVAVRTKAW